MKRMNRKTIEALEKNQPARHHILVQGLGSLGSLGHIVKGGLMDYAKPILLLEIVERLDRVIELLERQAQEQQNGSDS